MNILLYKENSSLIRALARRGSASSKGASADEAWPVARHANVVLRPMME